MLALFCCLVNPAPWRPPQKTCSSFIPSLPDESYANANASVLDVSLFKLSRYLNISYCICIALYTSVVPANIKSADGDVTPCQLKFSFSLIYRVLIQIAPARLSLSLSLSLAAYRLIRFLFDKSIGILPLVYTRPCAFAAVLTLSGASRLITRRTVVVVWIRDVKSLVISRRDVLQSRPNSTRAWELCALISIARPSLRSFFSLFSSSEDILLLLSSTFLCFVLTAKQVLLVFSSSVLFSCRTFGFPPFFCSFFDVIGRVSK